jgi:pimeloyl-ACP methyl ester carboxylesterase
MATQSFFRRRFWGFGIGAGLVGLLILTIRYAFRPPRRSRLPDNIFPAIFATRVMPTGKGQLVFHECGQGSPLAFVHGVYPGASSYEWSRIYPHFADRFQVLALDLIGFGESARPSRALSASDQASVLSEFLRAKGNGERATIVASGLGAGIATLVAAQHPELVQRLVLLMPTGLTEPGAKKYLRRGGWISVIPFLKQIYYRRFLATRAQIRAWLATFAFFDANRIDDEIVDVLYSFAHQYGAEKAIFQSATAKLQVDLTKRFAELTQPVTLIWCQNAVFPPLRLAYELQQVPLQCGLTLLEECGMLAPLEAPEELKKILDRELEYRIRLFDVG